MVIFDGHNIDELGIVGTPTITALNSRMAYREVSGRDGIVVESRTWGAPTVSFPLAIVGNALDRRDKLSVLASWLTVDGPRKLVLPDTQERYYMAIPSNSHELVRGVDNEIATIEFTITEPAAYGTERTITVPSGGSVTFTVNGTYPTKPTIEAQAVRNSTSQVWGLKLDNSKFVHVATGSASAVPVALDCNNRTSTVSGSVKLPTLDSDWLEFAPGTHTLAMDYGTGAATVTYRERWL